MTTPPFRQIPQGIGLRQRQKADGSWRVWWEPTAKARADGAKPVELDANRPTWSEREARRLHKTAGKTAPRPGAGGRTLEALAHDFQKSSRFNRKRPSTQAGYRADWKTILKKWGATHVATFTKPMVNDWYEERAVRTPTYAGKLLRSLSVLMAHAERIGWRPEGSNPCLNMGTPGAVARERYASWQEFDALVSAADRLGWHALGTAIVLAVFSGQRQADIIAAAPSDFVSIDTEQNAEPIIVWMIERSKRQNRGQIPLHPEASARMRACLPEDPESRDRLLIDEATRKPYSGDLFRKRWAAVRAEARKAAPSLRTSPLQFRDLRRTFGVWARHGGALREDVGDVLGNAVGTDDALARIYTPDQLMTTMRAVAAIRRPEEKKERRA